MSGRNRINEKRCYPGYGRPGYGCPPPPGMYGPPPPGMYGPAPGTYGPPPPGSYGPPQGGYGGYSPQGHYRQVCCSIC